MVIYHLNRLFCNKWTWGVFAIAISAFFAFDFLFTGRSSEAVDENSVGVLGGEGVSAETFHAVANEVRGFGPRRNYKMPAAELNRAVWERLALLRVADEFGCTASDAETIEAIRRNRSFADASGAFSGEIFDNVLRANDLSRATFVPLMKRDLSGSKVRVVLESAAWAAPSEVDRLVFDRTDKFTVRVASFFDKDAAKVKVTDAEIEAFYKDNTNSVALPDCATVRYVCVKAADPKRLAQFKITEDEMRDHYDATSARYETQTTNGVVTKKFEEVKGLVEKELQLLASVEAYRTNFLFRLYPADEVAGAAKKASRLDAIAKADKLTIKTSPLFPQEGERAIAGLTASVESFAPDAPDFASNVAGLDPESEEQRYAVVCGTNAVYVIERASFVKAHVPTFAEAKEAIRPAALADARAKAFKAAVEKQRALAAAAVAKGQPFDAKIFAGANVTTSMTFSAASLDRSSPRDLLMAARQTIKLAKGQISEFIPAGTARGLLVYVEKREAGDPATEQMTRPACRDEVAGRSNAGLFNGWDKWNLARLGLEIKDASTSPDLKEDESTVSED